MVDGPFGVEITKSFVNGKWQPITSIPKPSLNVAVERGTFGQKHLKDIAQISNKGMHKIARDNRFANRMVASQKVGLKRFEHPLASKDSWEAVSPSKGAEGPFVMATKSGNIVNDLDRKSMKTFSHIKDWKKDRAKAGNKFGRSVASSDQEMIRAHEAAHARPDKSRMGRGFNTELRSLNRGIQNVDYSDRSLILNARPDPSKSKYLNKLVRTPKKRLKWEVDTKKEYARDSLGTREESLADVLASRHLSRPVLSGHWNEPGYLESRNEIARSMGQPELKTLKVRKKK